MGLLEFSIFGVFIVAFPLFFLGVVFLLKIISGWGKLQNSYEYIEGGDQFENWGLGSMRLGVVNYNNVIRFKANRRGLLLSVMFPFGLINKTVLIPWNKIRITDRSGMLLVSNSVVEIETADGVVNMTLRSRWVDRMREHVGEERV